MSPCPSYTTGYLPRAIPQGHLLRGNAAGPFGMDKLKLRQAWVRKIIRDRCEGKISSFARAIGKDPSYVSRMLYPAEKDGAKGIGEDTVRAIIAAFPSDLPPSNVDVPPPELGGPASEPAQLFTKERRASGDVLALQIGLESLLVAVLERIPGAAAAFLSDARKVAKGHRFSTEAGFLGELLDIADEVRAEEEAATRARQRAGSVARTRRGNQGPKK
jgi:hypothetical protein